MAPRLFLMPGNASADTRHNWLASQKEGLLFGPTEAAASFLPVLLARLGASNVQVGLVTALPNLAGFLLAVPIGQFLQGRPNVGPWYARGRLLGQLSMLGVAIALLVVPADQVVPVILAVIAIAAVLGAFANFSFYGVFDSVAGPAGRYQLMGRRWGMKSAATAISLPVIGVVLTAVPFPNSYVLVFGATAIFAFGAFYYARTFRVRDQPARRMLADSSRLARARLSAREVLAQRRLLSFVGRHTVFVFGLSMALPLIPLYYVRVLGATDSWIGVIGTVQAVVTMSGYFLWREPARRRGASWVLIPSTLGAAAFPALLSFAHNEVIVAGLVAIYAFSVAGIELAIFDELLRAVPEGQAVRFAAFDQGATNFAGMTGPIVGAEIAALIGVPSGLLVAAVVAMIGAALFAASVIRRRRGVRAGSVPVAAAPAAASVAGGGEGPRL